MEKKPIHAKPSLYAYYFYDLKEIALKYGYNLVLHGSLNRDLDLIAIPWEEKIGPHEEMVEEFVEYLGGSLLFANGIDRGFATRIGESIDGHPKYNTRPHGRITYLININREGRMKNNEWIEPQFYIDLSIMPTLNKQSEQPNNI